MGVVFGVAKFDRKIKVVKGAADSNAEGAGVKLVEGNIFYLVVDGFLNSVVALHFGRAGDMIEENDDLPKDVANSFYKHEISSIMANIIHQEMWVGKTIRRMDKGDGLT